MTVAVADIKTYADFYRARGYQPLPSDPSRKKPLVRFGEYWTRPIEIAWSKFPDANIQVMCGVFWNLCVLDLDGRDAIRHFDASWTHHLPQTWCVFHSDGGESSRHYWFSVPRQITELSKRVLWKGDGEHSAIELLCDRSLIMAPPSIHPRTGNEYRFARGLGPSDIGKPARLPDWIVKLPAIGKEKEHPVHVASSELLERIGDKARIASSWGLRFAASPQESKGWVSVHDFNREDHNPSARFSLETGSFWRPGEPVIRFLDLGVALGRFATWQECRDWLEKTA